MSGRDPLGKRALFSAPASGETAPTSDPFAPAPEAGRRAFFSGGGDAAGAEAQGRAGGAAGGVATVTCRSCGRSTPVGLVGLGLRLSLSLWLPGRAWSRYLRCPSCGRWAWCRVSFP